MGNLCGKQSKDGFDGPGRTLGSAPAPATKASVPSTAKAGTGSTPKRTVGGPPRTLGEGNAASDPKAAAAAAAEARANKTSTGDLQKKLDAQKRQTREQTLKDAAAERRSDREVKQNMEALAHN